MATIKQYKTNLSEVTINGRGVLFSYSTPIAINQGGAIMATKKRFSVTTSRHLKEYLSRFPGVPVDYVDQCEIESLANGFNASFYQ